MLWETILVLKSIKAVVGVLLQGQYNGAVHHDRIFQHLLTRFLKLNVTSVLGPSVLFFPS